MSQLIPEAAAAEPEGKVKIRIEGLKKSFGELVVLVRRRSPLDGPHLVLVHRHPTGKGNERAVVV